MFVGAVGCEGGEGKDVLCTFVALDASEWLHDLLQPNLHWKEREQF